MNQEFLAGWTLVNSEGKKNLGTDNANYKMFNSAGESFAIEL